MRPPWLDRAVAGGRLQAGYCPREATVNEIWLDVQMWTGLRGHVQQFTEVACAAPDPAPVDTVDWQEWAAAYLEAVAEQDGWQPGRYHYTAEQRDDTGRALEVLVRGIWEWPGRG
jgi:hypothetical protein